MKKTWQLSRCAINKKAKNSEQNIFGLYQNNILLTDPFKIAEAFNSHFTKAPGMIIEQINPIMMQSVIYFGIGQLSGGLTHQSSARLTYKLVMKKYSMQLGYPNPKIQMILMKS